MEKTLIHYGKVVDRCHIAEITSHPMPDEAVIVGKAMDDLPVLINIHDPTLVLFYGDFDFSVIKSSVRLLKTKVDIVEITNSDFFSGRASDIIFALDLWCSNATKPTIVLIEDIFEIEMNAGLHRDFRSLITRYKSGRVSIVAKMPDNKYPQLVQSGQKFQFIDYFHQIVPISGDLYMLADKTVFYAPRTD